MRSGAPVARVEQTRAEARLLNLMVDYADAAELQVRHARPRAKEDEQDLASQLAGTAKV